MIEASDGVHWVKVFEVKTKTRYPGLFDCVALVAVYLLFSYIFHSASKPIVIDMHFRYGLVS